MPKHLLVGESLALPPIRHHWALLVRGAALPVLAALVLLSAVDELAQGLVPGDLRLLATLLVMVALGLWLIVVWLRWAEDTLTVTDQRVILEQGVFQRISKVIPLDRVQDVATVQTPLGRLLNYGSVEIDAAGLAGCERFDFVAAPELVRDRVFVVLDRIRRGA
jgi:uncharacterized membrane protein YdbT with pleckstrin-like domain